MKLYNSESQPYSISKSLNYSVKIEPEMYIIKT